MNCSNRGITLVALVITIIVLLILAGVSISLVVGDNGIMTRAKDAGTKTSEADALESFKLSVASLTTDYYGKIYSGVEVDEDSLAEYIEAKIEDDLKTSECTVDGFSSESGNQECTVTKGKSTITVYYTVSDDKGAISNISTTKTAAEPDPEEGP